MTDQRPTIVLPRELMQQLREQAPRYGDGGFLEDAIKNREEWLIERAIQWGYEQRGEVNEAQLQQARDQELEACCALMCDWSLSGDYLRAVRRPKPPSLKKQAWKLLETYGTSAVKLTADQCNTIRRALEALPDD